ncbi:aspartyl protease family protein [Terriglobus sp. RCC_193]|uniref:aspartyl protease family protein n=1 Tax=Terriglobus sp. RCC_193 TaxID=3239218 RepID=UPI0035234305
MTKSAFHGTDHFRSPCKPYKKDMDSVTRLLPKVLLLCSFFLRTGVANCQQSSAELKKLYDAHSCFQMREKVHASNTPLFYRAVAACNFRESRCAKELSKVQRQSTSADEVWEATSLLAQDALADGHYSEALKQVEALLKLRPTDKDAQNAQAFFGALTTSGDQRVVRHRRGQASVVQFDGNVGAKILVNGRSTAFIFDTGANVSVISEGQAKLLGLEVHAVDARMNVVTGAKIGFCVTTATSLRLGNVELKNVAFLVVGDDAEPFVEMPIGQRGILGLPVLLAAETLRMHDGVFDIGYKPARYTRDAANICAYGSTLNVELTHESKPLTFALDTGATHTDLYPLFASEFSDLLTSGSKETFTQKGIGSTQDFPVVTIKAVAFTLAGHPVVLSPARVFLKPSLEGSETLAGNLGMDVLRQGNQLTFDFHAMRISLK